MSGVPIDAIVSALQAVDILDYILMGSATLCFWDILISLDQEVERIWKSNWTFVKILFLINRWFPPILFVIEIYIDHFAGEEVCRLYHVLPVLESVSLAVVEITLVLRTNVLYESKQLLYFLSCGCFITVATAITSTGYLVNSLSHNNGILKLPMGISLCVTQCADPERCRFFLNAIWVPLVVFETLCVCLMVHKLWVETWMQKSGLAKTLFQNGIVSYIVILCVSMINIIICARGPVAYVNAGISPMRSIVVIACSRLLLNIRAPGERMSRTLDLMTLPTMDFERGYRSTRGEIAPLGNYPGWQSDRPLPCDEK